MFPEVQRKGVSVPSAATVSAPCSIDELIREAKSKVEAFLEDRKSPAPSIAQFFTSLRKLSRDKPPTPEEVAEACAYAGTLIRGFERDNTCPQTAMLEKLFTYYTGSSDPEAYKLIRQLKILRYVQREGLRSLDDVFSEAQIELTKYRYHQSKTPALSNYLLRTIREKCFMLASDKAEAGIVCTWEQALREGRDIEALTRLELGTRSKVSEPYIDKVESTHLKLLSVPYGDTLKRIAQTYRLSTEHENTVLRAAHATRCFLGKVGKVSAQLPMVALTDATLFSPQLAAAIQTHLADFVIDVDKVPQLRLDAFVTLRQKFRFDELGSYHFRTSPNLPTFVGEILGCSKARETITLGELLQYWSHCHTIMQPRTGGIGYVKLADLNVDSPGLSKNVSGFNAIDIQAEIRSNLDHLRQLAHSACAALNSYGDDASSTSGLFHTAHTAQTKAQLEERGFQYPPQFGDYFFEYIRANGRAMKSQRAQDGKSQFDIGEVQEYLLYCQAALHLCARTLKQPDRFTKKKLFEHKIAFSKASEGAGTQVQTAAVRNELAANFDLLGIEFIGKPIVKSPEELGLKTPPREMSRAAKRGIELGGIRLHPPTFGRLIKARAESLGKTLEDISKDMGIPAATIESWWLDLSFPVNIFEVKQIIAKALRLEEVDNGVALLASASSRSIRRNLGLESSVELILWQAQANLAIDIVHATTNVDLPQLLRGIRKAYCIDERGRILPWDSAEETGVFAVPLSREELARRLGVTTRLIGAWEQSKEKKPEHPTPQHVEGLVKIYALNEVGTQIMWGSYAGAEAQRVGPEKLGALLDRYVNRDKSLEIGRVDDTHKPVLAV